MVKNLVILKIYFIAIGILLISCASGSKSQGARPLLKELTENTYSKQDWFVPLLPAIMGISADQAIWRDTSDNHSIAQLVTHLIFWNNRILSAFKGNEVPDFDGDNNRTFIQLSDKDWNELVGEVQLLESEWKQVINNASRQKIIKWQSEIANMCAHNAYHTGQIIYIRKQNEWWR
ncbi:MAG: DinB family protein [Saprospiraceae bacterium]|nr:DinB family protein [Saprospiraceae bacterium]